MYLARGTVNVELSCNGCIWRGWLVGLFVWSSPVMGVSGEAGYKNCTRAAAAARVNELGSQTSSFLLFYWKPKIFRETPTFQHCKPKFLIFEYLYTSYNYIHCTVCIYNSLMVQDVLIWNVDILQFTYSVVILQYCFMHRWYHTLNCCYWAKHCWYHTLHCLHCTMHCRYLLYHTLLISYPALFTL